MKKPRRPPCTKFPALFFSQFLTFSYNLVKSNVHIQITKLRTYTQEPCRYTNDIEAPKKIPFWFVSPLLK
uniref:Uncharacterized protein n=1 Tax=Pararge aegeria TaxID=116150 RepID=S4NKP5_9NEOP